jgi:valyl-tRNA synthetase
VLEVVRGAEADLRAAGKITGDVVYTEGEGDLVVTAEVVPPQES